MDFQYRAQEAYKRGEYQKSYALYTKALQGCRDVELEPTYLEQRVFVCLKLAKSQPHRLDDALTDAKRMVQIARQNPRAYMCLGNVLRKRNQEKAAAKVYEAGVERCNKTSVQYQALAKLARQHQQVNKHGRDFTLVLPYELLDIVFTQLPFKTLVKCLGVSKSWRNFVSGNPRLWNDTIDFSKMKRGVVTKRLLATYLQYSVRRGARPRSLVVRNMRGRDQEECLQVIKRARPEIVDVECSVPIPDLGCRILKVNGDGDLFALMRLKGLEELCVRGTCKIAGTYPDVSRLKRLRVEGTLPPSSVDEIVRFNLTSLELINCFPWNEVRGVLEPYLDQRCMESFVFRHQSSTEMPVLGFKEVARFAFHGAFRCMTGYGDWAKLSYLDLSRIRLTSIPQFVTFLQNNCVSRLTTLVLDYAQVPVKGDELGLLNKFEPRLLSLQGMAEVNDSTVNVVRAATVILSSTNVTGVGVSKLVKLGAKNVAIEHCNISVDSYKWLQRNARLLTSEQCKALID